jgi:hypothetical protein
MAKVTPAKIDLYEQEIKAGAAASEATMQRIASSVNFWNAFYEGQRGWFLNGKYGILGVPQTGVDGAYPCVTDMELYGFCMYNLVAGSNGSTELDVIVRPSTGSPFSLFTVKPKIPYNSGNNARMIINVSTNTVVAQSSFVTLPTFAVTTLSAGTLLTLDLTQAQTGGESCGLLLALRPYST